MRVAVFSPLPPSPSGVADYTHVLLEGIRRREPAIEVEAYTDSSTGKGETAYPVYGCEAFRERQASLPASVAVYQMGNSSHHDFIYPFITRYPGILVLHDLVLHHARLASYLGTPDVVAYRHDIGDQEKRSRALARLEDYSAEVQAAYPGKGDAVAEIALRMGGGRLLYTYPLFELLARASRMVLVHSSPAKQRVLESCPVSVVRTVRMGIDAPAIIEREKARRKLGIGPGLVLASFGLVTPEKRISMSLRALRRLHEEGIDATYFLVGDTVSHYDALAEAAKLGMAGRIRLTGRVSEDTFWLYALAADLCLNLRYPTAGETSAALLRLLAAGRAVMVTDQVPFLDFPDDVVARVSLEGDEDGLFCDLLDLLRDGRRRRRLEERARRFAVTEHSVEAMVADYVTSLEEAQALPAPRLSPEQIPRHWRD